MINYGVQKSTVKPQEIEITEDKIFIYSGIREISENEFIGYEFNLQEYSKDEFVRMQLQRSSVLEKQIQNTQSVLIENID